MASQKTITLIGPARSGKTNLLATALHNRSCWKDLETGRTHFFNAVLDKNPASDEESETNWHHLNKHYNAILHGKDDLVEGTDIVRYYSTEFSHSGLSAKKKSSSFISNLFPGRSKPTSTSFNIVDGRGGDIAPDELISREDENAYTRQATYREAIKESVGVVICLPILDVEFDQAVSEAMLAQINLALSEKRQNRKSKPLEHVALCLTKYENVFLDSQTDAGHFAVDRDGFIKLVKDSAIVSLLSSLLRASRKEDAKTAFKTRIFPVSTFGFVRGEGAANFYPYEHASGLLTRAIDEVEYDNPALENLRDHFPVPLTEASAQKLWRPFNIVPPLIYALTGQETGPLSVSGEDLE